MIRPRKSGSDGTEDAQGLALAADRARSFRQAKRHTHIVRLMKVALPVAALAAAGSYGVTLLSVSALKEKGITAGPVKIDPKNLTMQDPRYNGFGKDGSHFVVHAKEAVSDWRQTGPVRLNVIDGDITQPSGQVIKLKADWGTFDQKKDLLELYDRIDIDGSTGLKARLTRATVYTKESRVVSDKPIYAVNETGEIRAQHMTFNSKSHKASFSRAVHVTMKPAPAQQKSEEARKPTQSLLPGMAANSGQPINVHSEQLDVDDQAKIAIFRTNVRALQGDASLVAPELHIHYEGKAAAADLSGKPATDGNAQTRLKLIKARGGVTMVNKDDKAVAEALDYDALAERATLSGNVVMTSTGERQISGARVDLDQKADTALVTGNVVATQGRNLLKGERLFIARGTGKMRLESPSAHGRIHTTFYQNQAKPGVSQKVDTTATQAAQSPLGGFGTTFKTDSDAPIEIEAETLDVADAKKIAIYTGNVIAKQGAFVVQTAQLTAHYVGSANLDGTQPSAPKAKGAATTGAQPAQLRRVEARQKVVVTGKDGQKAVGDWANFDVAANTIVMGGKVIVTQGKNIIDGPEGTRFLIDMSTGITRFEQDGRAAKAWGPVVSSTTPATSAASGAAAAAVAATPRKRMRAVFHPKDAETAAKAGEKSVGQDLKKKKKRAGKDKPAASSWQASTTATGQKP
ncbi:MAG: LptA/OstA family protein [Hyphomicrobiaceae bacterium]